MSLEFRYEQRSLIESAGASVNFDPVDVRQYRGYSVQIIATGTPSGSYKLQVSNELDIGSLSNWTDIINTEERITGPGSTIYNVSSSFYSFFRLVYTRTSGTGTLTANIVCKE